MKNTIAERVADFLSRYSPFSFVEESQLLEIAKEVNVIYTERGKPVFRQFQEVQPFFYEVNKGAVALSRTEEDIEVPMDKCDEGDLFGLRPLIAKGNYLINAFAEEESIL